MGVGQDLLEWGRQGGAEFQKTPGASLSEMGVEPELPRGQSPRGKAGKPRLLGVGGRSMRLAG